MKMKKLVFPVVLLVLVFAVSACSSTFAALPFTLPGETNQEVVERSQAADSLAETEQEERTAQQVPVIDPGLLAAYENTLTEIYDQVSPSVVNIRVVGSEQAVLADPNQIPPLPGLPELPDLHPPTNQSLGSGFVWDKEGHIITNNHVIEGAKEIEVTFSDELVADAELVGADPDSDLAVIKVDVPTNELQPITIADSEQVRVGQLAIAIGNPFGLEGTMTVGIVSALGRSMQAGEGFTGGPVYSIPDVIQTDAPINPGNSGGVLLNASGELIGVTTAIESPVRANAGIGFVVPASIVSRVVPQLIENGHFAHPYLGITGISLYPDLAEAMDLARDQRGALVAEVVVGGPADKGGLLGSEDQVTLDGMEVNVGGDVIIEIDGNPVQDMDDLIAYLSSNTVVDQEVSLLILRDGAETEVQVTLEARPAEKIQTAAVDSPHQGRAWLGILGMPLNPEIAKAMQIEEDQSGVVVLDVTPDSPAEAAGLESGIESFDLDGEQIQIGGDVITEVDGRQISDVQGLAAYFQEVGPGAEVTLTVLRDGDMLSIDVELGQQP